MANYTHFEKHELGMLRDQFVDLAHRDGNPATISRAEMQEALSVAGIVDTDKEVLDRLFTMFDRTGDDQVYFREFISGFAALITSDVKEKLHFAFQMYDLEGLGNLAKEDILKVLSSINRTASYFGDACLTEEQVVQLVEDVFQQPGGKSSNLLYYQDFLAPVMEHAHLNTFISGKGPARYGQGLS